MSTTQHHLIIQSLIQVPGTSQDPHGHLDDATATERKRTAVYLARRHNRRIAKRDAAREATSEPDSPKLV